MFDAILNDIAGLILTEVRTPRMNAIMEGGSKHADTNTDAVVGTHNFITVEGPDWRQPPADLYVVLREAPDGAVQLARPGGENGRYWHGDPRRLITVIDPVRITLSPPLA